MKKPSSKIVAIASLMLLIALSIPVINAQTVTVTVDSEPVQWEDTFTVEGTGFSASTPVAIGVGEEVTITDEFHEIPEPAGNGPFIAITNHYPIKPGSFSFHCDVSDVTSDYYDDYANGAAYFYDNKVIDIQPALDAQQVETK